ncbi:MAG: hypothetical protein RL093_730 [Pseudomonadota bacterium]|jgi:hypothetical protein
MQSVPIGFVSLLLAATPTAAQYPSAAHAPPPGSAPAGACEIRPDAPYINPRLPLGRAAYAHRPACRTTWAPGSAGPGVYVQGPPVQVEAPPVSVGGLMIYLVPPEIVVRPSEVTVEPPQVYGEETAPESPVPDTGD